VPQPRQLGDSSKHGGSKLQAKHEPLERKESPKEVFKLDMADLKVLKQISKPTLEENKGDSSTQVHNRSKPQSRKGVKRSSLN